MERDYTLLIPEYIAAGGAVLIIALELTWPRMRKDLVAYLTAFVALAWGISALFWVDNDPKVFQGLVRFDDFTTFFRVLGAGIVFIVALLSATYMRDRTRAAAEYYGLLLIGGCGLVYMAAAQELITAYISLEVLSFSLYILVGYLKRDNLSSEASLKYILLGAFSSAMFLYGISLLYGVTGSTHYDEIRTALANRNPDDTDIAVVLATMLILAGVGFKISAAPFHMWAPDAYEGAPLPITGFLSTASKAAGFALILRLFSVALTVDSDVWKWAVAALAAVTMTAGNLLAIQQTNMKRLVAYSSIGQVGYMLVVIAAIGYGDAETGRNASSGLLLHMAGYVISTLALFTALTAYYNKTGKDTVAGLSGLAETQPFLAMIIVVSLFSFAGLPFFAGFATKLFMFQGSVTGGLLWLVGLAVANSFVSLYYYLMILRRMYLFGPDDGLSRFRVSPVLGAVGGALMLGVLFIGMYPGPLFQAAEDAAKPLFQAGGAEQVQAP